ncbi:nuclear transport factor 2 family protein [Dyadobacter sp. NIV53]|uniref:nuclear transport factor 2 family protein n=1 Tax=Dyadobacter sp. NIV53 TaxID=2861765 RepID=UPI001C878F22|nr:nuclear transport factor 2 family protein [Dyadobacter sp. NIV53]
MSKVPANHFFTILVLTLIFNLSHQTLLAQKQDSKIRAVVDKLFDGMKAGDSAMIRSVFMNDNAFSTISKNSRDSVTVRSDGNADGFIKAVGTPHNEIWDERIYNVKISVDGPMAIVWAPYKFYRGETFSHCGVNVFTMIETTTGWKIREITDTRRKTDCP